MGDISEQLRRVHPPRLPWTISGCGSCLQDRILRGEHANAAHELGRVEGPIPVKRIVRQPWLERRGSLAAMTVARLLCNPSSPSCPPATGWSGDSSGTSTPGRGAEPRERLLRWCATWRRG